MMPNDARTHDSCFNGFTLIEMLIVLVLVGLMAGSVVVSLEGRQELYSLRASGKELAAALSYAARQARLLGRPHRLVIDSEGRYAVERLAADGSGNYEVVEGLAGTARALGKGVKVAIEPGSAGMGAIEQAGSRFLAFTPDGRGFEGELVVRRDKETLRIRVSGATGQVHILE